MTPDEDPTYIDYEVTYPLGFVVSVPEDATIEEIAEAYSNTVDDWAREGNQPVIEHLDIHRLGDDNTDHTFSVTISGCTREQAEQVMQERLGPDEDYGFDYTVDWN